MKDIQTLEQQWIDFLLSGEVAAPAVQKDSLRTFILTPLANWIRKRWRALVPRQAYFTQMAVERAGITRGEIILNLVNESTSYAVGSLPAAGETGKVIFTGRDEYWLSICRTFVERAGWSKQSEMILATDCELPSLSGTTVDVIISATNLHWLTKEECGRLFQVLNPGGRLSLVEWSPENRNHRLAHTLDEAGFSNISTGSDEAPKKPRAFTWWHLTAVKPRGTS